MVASVQFGRAEIELEYWRERQARCFAVAKRLGGYHGRQRGTTKAKPGRARKIWEQGLSVAEIAHALAVSDSTVFRSLAEGLHHPAEAVIL
jgi:DNA invertase Pin-like site-specific DNA recombinase